MKQYFMLLCCVLALTCQVVAMSTNHWSTKSIELAGGKETIWFGPWKMCKKGQYEGDLCQPNYPRGIPGQFPVQTVYVVRYLGLVAIAFMILAFATMYYKPNNHSLHNSMLLASVICMAGSSVIWATKAFSIEVPTVELNQIKLKPGYSYYMALSGSVFPLVAMMLM